MPIPKENIEIYKQIPKPIDDPFGGPEGIAYANDGNIYVGCGDGWIYFVSLEGKVVPFANTGGRPLGIAMDRNGELFVCDMNARLVHRVTKSGKVSVFAQAAGEHQMQAPNFCVFDDQGWLYISDSGSSTLDAPINDGAIFRVSPSGECDLFAEGFYLPNGLAMRSGESALYVIQTTEDNILRLEIKPDRSLGEIGVYASGMDTIPDGMAFAENGDLYVVAAGSDMIYQVFPDGQSSVFAHDPDREGFYAAANCAFGGTDGNQLFISNLGGHISRIANVSKGQPLYHQLLK